MYTKTPEIEEELFTFSTKPKKLIVLEMGFFAYQIKSRKDQIIQAWESLEFDESMTGFLFSIK
jgi:hypothetical protein